MRQFQSNNRLVCQRGALPIAVLLLLVLLTFIPKMALAASSCVGTLSVTVSTTGMTFGNYDVLIPTPTSGTGGITVSATCNLATLPFTVNYTIALSTGGSGSFTPRNLASGTNKLQYNLYTSVSYASIWGDGTGGTQTVSDAISGTCQNQLIRFGRICNGSNSDTVYGNIPAMQDAVPGSYSDSITATISF